MAVLLGGKGTPFPSFVPPNLQLAFGDEFTELSIEDGDLAGTGANWADKFLQFNVRHLAGNQDECYKARKEHFGAGTQTLEQLGMPTTQIDGSSLLMGAFEIPAANRPQFFGFPYCGVHLDSRRSCNFSYGYVEARFRILNIGPGIHWTCPWLWPSDRNDFELDLVEIIGSNVFAPNGPVPIIFQNSHDNRPGANHSATYPITQTNIPAADLTEWHVYGLHLTPTEIQWFYDGVLTRTIPNVYPPGQVWHIFVSLEMGASANSDFPGPVNANTPLPHFAELDYVRVHTENGPSDLVTPPSLPLP